MLKIFDLTVRFPRFTVAFALLFAAGFAAFLPKVQRIENVDYFNVDDEDSRFYVKFKEQFGSDEFFIIAVEDSTLFTAEKLNALKSLTAEIEKIEEVREVKSLANIDSVEGGRDTFEVREFLESVPADADGLQKLKRQAIADPIYRNNLISADGLTSGILVYTYDRRDDQRYRKRLLGKVHEILDRHYPNKNYRLAGWTVTNLSLSEILNSDMRVFVPLSFFLVCFIIHLLFKNWRVTFLATINIGFCLISTLGLFGVTGITFNNLTSIVLPLAVTLSLADTIHVFSHLDSSLLGKGRSDAEVMSGILKSLVKPCLLTSITTAAGFLSLAVSRIGALVDFAQIAAAAMIFEFFYSFFLVPQLALLIGAKKVFSDLSHESDTKSTKLLSSHFLFIQRHRVRIVVAGIIISIVGAYLTTQVRVETNVLKYFWNSSELIQSLNFTEKRLGGVQSVNVSLKAPDDDFFKDPKNLEVVDDISKFAKSLQGVDVSLSLVDLLKEMNKSFNEESERFYTLPDSVNKVEQYLLLYEGGELDDYIDSGYSHARILIRTNIHGTKSQKVLLSQLEKFIHERTAGTPIVPRLTGQVVNMVNVSREMVDGQISSFATATLVVGIIMILVLRSVSLGILSLVPNIFPILINFGVMGLFGIPLDTGTVMIASVALGIAVDDTIHFLMKYQSLRRGGRGRTESLKYVVLHKGRAIVSSAIILTVGFGVLMFGDFVPVVSFGVLTVVVMTSAITGDLLLLPALMLLKGDEAKSSKSK